MNEEFIGYAEQVSSNISKEMAVKLEKVLIKSLSEKGIDLDEASKNIQLITIEGDKFEHYYLYHGKPTEQRILSIERTPTASYADNKITMERKYY